MRIEPSKSWLTALHDYEQQLKAIVARYPDADILELGGGRWPSFRRANMPDNVRTYTVNDVDPEELALAAPEYETACFDVTGDASDFADRYDVVFSRFLAEHVRDGRAMHRNVLKILKPGGVAFHLIPTLYASPFLVNKLVPEAIAGKLLSAFTPRRSISPKFPAYYSECYGDTKRMRRMFGEIGYSRVDVRSFYGHFYYEKIPGLRELEQFLSSLAARRGWSWYGSYAYVTAYK